MSSGFNGIHVYNLLTDVYGLVRLKPEHPCPTPDDVHGLVHLTAEHPCPQPNDVPWSSGIPSIENDDTLHRTEQGSYFRMIVRVTTSTRITGIVSAAAACSLVCGLAPRVPIIIIIIIIIELAPRRASHPGIGK